MMCLTVWVEQLKKSNASHFPDLILTGQALTISMGSNLWIIPLSCQYESSIPIFVVSHVNVDAVSVQGPQQDVHVTILEREEWCSWDFKICSGGF